MTPEADEKGYDSFGLWVNVGGHERRRKLCSFNSDSMLPVFHFEKAFRLIFNHGF